MKTPTLTHLQLCDLANFVLALPQKTLQGTTLRPLIDPCVTNSWNGTIRYDVEHWCDGQLRQAGLEPRRREHRKPCGRPLGRSEMPREIQSWTYLHFGRQAVA